MKHCLILLCFLYAALSILSDPQEFEFQTFINTYNKNYGAEEYDKRFEIFKSNLIKAQQLDDADPHATYGVTKFMDLTPEEFKSLYLMPNFTSPKMEGKPYPVLEWNSTDLKPLSAYPPAFDWRSQGVVTAVYDQGQCGSCWAFSTTEQIESMWARAGHGLSNLAMQQLVDCDTWSHGCAGGNPPNAYQYVMDVGGIDSYASYPYVGADQSCRFNPSTVGAKVRTYGYISTNDNEAAMLSWTSTYGPPSVCVDAEEWQYYTGGIITTGCGNTLDHCVQITGWDTINGVGAWVVRNSWGTNWGYGGYLYVLYGADMCGIGQEATGCFTP